MLGTKMDLSTFPVLMVRSSLPDWGELPLATLAVVQSDPA